MRKTYHRLREAVPWTHHGAVPDIPQPELPSVMEAYFVSPHADHTVYVGKNVVHGDYVDHCLSAETPPALDAPEHVNTGCLRGEAENRQIA